MIRALTTFAALCAIIFALGRTAGHADEPQKRVLLIYPYTELIPSTAIISETMRERLKQRSPIKVDFRTAFLDFLRVPDEAIKLRTAQYLAEIYKGESFDVIVALYAAGLRFAIKYRDLFAPKVPIVFCCPPSVSMSDLVLPNDVTGIVAELNADKTLELAERLQPEAKNLLIISGSADMNRNGIEELRPQLSPYVQRLKTTYLTDVTYDAVLKTVSSLPHDTIVLYYSILADTTGRTFVPAEAAGPIARAASVPVYGLFDTYMGTGIVGGHTATFEEGAKLAADLALDIMSGKAPNTIVPQTDAGNFRVDERALRRWGLNAGRLPADTIVYFKQPTAWDQYRDGILLAAAAVLLQAGLIAWLLLERDRRRRAEVRQRDTMSDLMHVDRMTTAAELSASIAHEVAQPLTSMVSNANAGIRWLNHATPNIEEAGAAFKQIVTAGRHAGEVITSVRTLFKKETEGRTHIDLNQLIRNAVSLEKSAIDKHDVSLSLELNERIPKVIGDRVQLLQVLLNLIRNAIDAIGSNELRVLQIRSRVDDSGNVLVSVEDSGSGIKEQDMDRIFDRLFTTKSQGLGIGLSICRSIIEGHDGRLWVISTVGQGSTFFITLPRYTAGDGWQKFEKSREDAQKR
jgi:signal transduction histidine kinase